MVRTVCWRMHGMVDVVPHNPVADMENVKRNAKEEVYAKNTLPRL